MEKRNAEWEAKKLKFINARMDELKGEILEHAGSELFKENNKKIIQQIEDLNLQELTIYLNNKFPSLQNSKWVCEGCNESFVKKINLTNHKKKCGKPVTIINEVELKIV